MRPHAALLLAVACAAPTAKPPPIAAQPSEPAVVRHKAPFYDLDLCRTPGVKFDDPVHELTCLDRDNLLYCHGTMVHLVNCDDVCVGGMPFSLSSVGGFCGRHDDPRHGEYVGCRCCTAAEPECAGKTRQSINIIPLK